MWCRSRRALLAACCLLPAARRTTECELAGTGVGCRRISPSRRQTPDTGLGVDEPGRRHRPKEALSAPTALACSCSSSAASLECPALKSCTPYFANAPQHFPTIVVPHGSEVANTTAHNPTHTLVRCQHWCAIQCGAHRANSQDISAGVSVLVRINETVCAAMFAPTHGAGRRRRRRRGR